VQPKSHTRFSLFLLLAAMFVGGCEPAAAKDDDTSKAEPIFNGKDLAGWVVTGDGCEAGVENGLLVIKAGDGFVRYDKELTDFVLEVEWKALREKEYDSGIYFRSPLELPKGRAYPEKHQINLKDGDEGNLIGSKTGHSTGLIMRGEWNAFTLRVAGKTAELHINGKPAWKADGIEPASGYVGIQVEVPGGGQFQFRNIRLKTL
jgi:hypothetical protein